MSLFLKTNFYTLVFSVFLPNMSFEILSSDTKSEISGQEKLLYINMRESAPNAFSVPTVSDSSWHIMRLWASLKATGCELRGWDAKKRLQRRGFHGPNRTTTSTGCTLPSKAAKEVANAVDFRLMKLFYL